MPAPMTRKPTKAASSAVGGGKSPYRLGRDFERSIRGRLERRGYFVIRAPGSKGHNLVLPSGEKAHSKIDELAVKSVERLVSVDTLDERGRQITEQVAQGRSHIILGVQCKRRGDIGSTEWNELFDVCQAFGIMPVVAVKASERTAAFYRLDEHRERGRRGRPWTEIDPATGAPLPMQTELL